MKNLLTIVGISLLLLSCRSYEEKSIRQTVIVYISGENNLVSNISADLAEMAEGSKQLSDDEKLIAFVDGYGLPYIIEFNNGKRDTIMRYDQDFYASDPEMFYDIIRKIESQYPTTNNNYALVLWGHGDGWVVKDSVASSAKARGQRRAYGQDVGYDIKPSQGEKWMNITQMARVLERLPRFRYIMADCCCFITVENAYELRNVADFLIGSPAETPNLGAPYHLIMRGLFGKTEGFYQDIVDNYFDYYANLFKTSAQIKSEFPYVVGHSLPLTVVDLRQNHMEDLAMATRNVLKEPDSYATDSIAYFIANDLPLSYDAKSIMKRNLSSDAFQGWEQALNAAIPYKKFSGKWMTIYRRLYNALSFDQFKFDEDNFGGIGMHIPSSAYKSNPSYNNGIKNFGWYQAVGWNRFE